MSGQRLWPTVARDRLLDAAKQAKRIIALYCPNETRGELPLRTQSAEISMLSGGCTKAGGWQVSGSSDRMNRKEAGNILENIAIYYIYLELTFRNNLE